MDIVCDIERIREDLENIAISDEFKVLAKNITLNEYFLLRSLSKPSMLRKSSIRIETIRDNLPPQRKDIPLDDALRRLRNKHLINWAKRNDNWKITTLGKKFANVIMEYEARKFLQKD